MSLKRLFLFSGLATVCFVILLLIDRFQPALLTHFRNLERDAISRAGRRAAANPDLVFMAIDSDSVTLDTATDVHELYGLTTNDSIETRALQLMSQAWPWPREVYALVLQRLIDAGAKVVALDLTFPTATPDDPILRTTLDRYRDKVVIGSNFISAASHGYAVIDASLTRPSESLIPQTTPTDEDEVVRQAQSSYCRFPSAPITTILPRKIRLSDSCSANGLGKCAQRRRGTGRGRGRSCRSCHARGTDAPEHQLARQRLAGVSDRHRA